MPIGAQDLIQASYFVTAVLFIMGLKRMSSPVTARSGITWREQAQILPPSPDAFDSGRSVAVDGDTIADRSPG